MRLLILNQFFWPDAAPTGELAGDLARELVARGHTVTVLCGRNEYYQGRPGEPAPPVDIVRIANTRFSRRTAGRLLSWSSFLAFAAWKSTRLPPADLVLAMTTPPGLSLIGVLLKRLRGAKLWTWEMDLYPDVAAATGALRASSAVYRSAGAIMNWARRQADGILVLGECMKARLLGCGLPAEKVCVAENWADGTTIQPVPFPPTPPLMVLYSGNLGLAHDVDTVSQVMRELRDDGRFRFSFAGGGALRGALEDYCHTNQLSSVEFRPYCERNQLPQSLGSCHVGLVTLNPTCLGTVVPSKVYTLMAAGRPILFIGPPESTAARLIDRYSCGWQVQPGDVAGTVSLLRSLAQAPDVIQEAGARARAAFVTHYDLPHGVARIAAFLEAPSGAPVP